MHAESSLILDETFLTEQADAIRAAAARSSADIIEIGKRLIAVKDALPHGEFDAWTDREFGWSRTTAYRFIQVAEAFGNRPNLGYIAPSALYALASGSVPDEVREQFISKAEAGEAIRHRDVRAVLTELRPVPPTAPILPIDHTPRITRQPFPDDSPDYDRGDGWADEAPAPIDRRREAERRAEESFIRDEREKRENLTRGFVRGLVALWSAVLDRPDRVMAEWVDGIDHWQGQAAVYRHLFTADGIRDLARSLDTIADEVDRRGGTLG